MKKIKQRERPYMIRYIRGERALMDSATTLIFARERVAARFAKRANKDETAEIWLAGSVIERRAASAA